MLAAADQLTTDRFPGEKTEAQHLSDRLGADYSLGHRCVYTGPIALIADGERALSILDVGSGVGWGYRKMADRLNLARYVGIERHADSAAYHRATLSANHEVLNDSIFSEDAENLFEGGFDYVFCIEVAEHVKAEYHPELFSRLHRALKPGGLAFLSTPNAAFHAHGNLTPTEAKAALKAAGFASVVCHAEHWTTLYIAEAAQ